MNIGEPRKTIIVEPLEDPRKIEEPIREPSPIVEPVEEPVSVTTRP